EVHYELLDNDGGRFAIDAATGEIKAGATSINREVDGASRQVTVRATSDDGSFTEHTYTINVGDVDEFDVTAPIDNNAAANAVNENAANGTAVAITAFSHDDDATTNAVTYSIVDSYGSGDVRNGLFTVGSISGIVTVADSAHLDREAVGASVDVTVRATSADG